MAEYAKFLYIMAPIVVIFGALVVVRLVEVLRTIRSIPEIHRVLKLNYTIYTGVVLCHFFDPHFPYTNQEAKC